MSRSAYTCSMVSGDKDAPRFLIIWCYRTSMRLLCVTIRLYLLDGFRGQRCTSLSPSTHIDILEMALPSSLNRIEYFSMIALYSDSSQDVRPNSHYCHDREIKNIDCTLLREFTSIYSDSYSSESGLH